MHIYSRKRRLTLCQWFLSTFRVFGTAPGFPVPARAALQAIQVAFLGLLSPQLPANFCLMRISMRIISSLKDQVVEVFPLLSFLLLAILACMQDDHRWIWGKRIKWSWQV